MSESLEERESALYCLCALLDKVEDLVELCCEEVECCEDAAVGPQIVPLRGQPQRRVAGRGRKRSGTASAHCFMTSW